jgi:hypothetical protein
VHASAFLSVGSVFASRGCSLVLFLFKSKRVSDYTTATQTVLSGCALSALHCSAAYGFMILFFFWTKSMLKCGVDVLILPVRVGLRNCWTLHARQFFYLMLWSKRNSSSSDLGKARLVLTHTAS